MKIKTLLHSHWERAATTLIILMGIFFIVKRIGEFPVGAIGDDAYYVEMARSIAERRGPVIYYHPKGAPGYHYAFPLGYPLLLSPIAFLFPYSVSALKALSIIATLGLIPIYGLLLKTIDAKRERMVLMALTFLNPWVIAYSNRVMSDVTYTFLSLAALLVYGKWLEGVRLFRPRFALLIVLLGLSATVRTIGLSLLIAVIAHLLLTKRLSHALVLISGVALTLVPQILMNLSTGGRWFISPGYYGEVISHSSNVWARLVFMESNFVGYLREMPMIMLPIFGNPTFRIASSVGMDHIYPYILLSTGVVLAGFISGGILTSVFSSVPVSQVILLYLLTYMFGLLNFSGSPSNAQLRLLLPILPLLYLMFIKGLQTCMGILHKNRVSPRTLPLWVLLLILPMSLAHNLYRLASPLKSSREASGKGYVDMSLGSKWVLNHTLPSDVFMTQMPLFRHIHLCRPVIHYSDLNESAIAKHSDRYDVKYIFIGPHYGTNPGQLDEMGKRMLELLNQHAEKFEIVYSDPNEKVFIYRVKERRDEIVP